MAAQFSEAYPDAAPAAAEDDLLPVHTAPQLHPVETTAPVTVVVPTRNERGNIASLVERLAAALPDGQAQVVFVDDSDDGTPEEIERVAAGSTIRVEVVHRPPGSRDGGLGGAVMRGFGASASPWVVVMDADLQHPPEVVPQLVARAELTDADVVVASRHVPGGDAAGLAGLGRVLVSRASILLTKALFPQRLAGVSDPMSGFFVVRRASVDAERLRPQGFKILLETLARHRGLRKTEVPFVFGDRLSGDSKASLAEGLTFVRQVVRLRLALLGERRPGVVRRALGFAAVGASGLVVNTAALWVLADPRMLALHYLLAAALATQVSSTWNFALVDTAVYRGAKRGTRLTRYLGFMAMSNSALLLRVPLLALFVRTLGVHYLIANALTLLLAFLVRFGSQERLTLMENSRV